MTAQILTLTLYVALAVYVLLIGYVVYRVWRGENGIDRLMGVDLISTLMIGALVMIGLIEHQNLTESERLLETKSLFVDVALGLAALSFIGVVAFARYSADRRLY